MSDKKLNAIKEIEFRVNKVKEITQKVIDTRAYDECNWIERIDDLLFDINDFINDLKDE